MPAIQKLQPLQPNEPLVTPRRLTPVERADAADRKARAERAIAQAAKGIVPAIRQELVHLNGQLDHVMGLSRADFFAQRRASRGR